MVGWEHDFAFAGLERVAGLTGGGAAAAVSGVLAGVELWSESLFVDGSALLGGADGGGGIDGDAESGMTGPCATRGSSPVEVLFIEAQPGTERTARNPAITNRRIDGSRYPEGTILHLEHAAPPEFTPIRADGRTKPRTSDPDDCR